MTARSKGDRPPDRGAGGRPGTFLTLALLLLSLALVPGCSWFRHKDMAKATPEGLYRQGIEDYQSGRFTRSVESFRRVKEEFPLSPLAILAEMGIADAYFSDGNFVEAEGAYMEFASLHPTNENLPYVFYQLGMCHYNQMSSIDRDQSETVKAQKEFERLIARFPSSRFAFMAERKLMDCRRALAEQEFYIGRFYFKMKKYRAALKRFEGIARDYANLGLDYKVDYFLRETRRHLAAAEAGKKAEAPAGSSSAPIPTP